jgi:hypothetical protein
MNKTKLSDAEEDLPAFIKWSEFVQWLFPHTEKFPKRARFTLALRIENLALDIIEDLVEARYTRNKTAILRRINLRLEKMRILLRFSHGFRYLSTRSYEFAVKTLNQTGAMIGGWIKQQENK